MWRPWILSLFWISLLDILIFSEFNYGGIKHDIVFANRQICFKKLQMAFDEKEKIELKHGLFVNL
jgi:hypothetical protein